MSISHPKYSSVVSASLKPELFDATKQSAKKRRQGPRLTRKFRALSFAVAVAALSSRAQAANLTFDPLKTGTGSSGSNVWDLTTTDWSTGTADQVWTQTNATTPLNAAIFAGGTDGASDAYTVTLNTALSASALTFNNSGYDLLATSAQTLTLSNTGTTTITVANGKTASLGNNLTTALISTNGAASIVIAVGGASGGTLNIEAGSTMSYLNAGGAGQLSFRTATNTSGESGIINLSGTLNNTTTGTITQISLGQNAGTTVTMNVNSGGVINNASTGAANNLGSLLLSNNGAAAVLNINSGGTVTLSGTASTAGLNVARGAGSTGAGSGTVNLNGGTLTTARLFSGTALASNTTATSTVNFNGGTLTANVTNNTDFMKGLTRANVRDGGALINTNGFNVTIGQALVHSNVAGNNPNTGAPDSATDGGLTKSGAGTLTLTGVNTYTGATAITAGTLAVNNATGSGTGTGAVNVNSGGTLTGTGTISGLTTFNTGSTLLAATTGTILTTSGGVTFAGQTSLTLSGTVTTGSTYTVLNYGGTLTGLANVVSTSRGTVGNTGTAVTFTVGSVASDTWAVTSGTWDAGVTPNWTNGMDNKFFNGDTVTFGDNNPGGTNTVTLTGNLQPATPVTVNNSTTAYTFSGSGSIGGPASLTKSGSGLLTINTANSYTGGTTINGGTVAINSATSLGDAAGAVAINAATMEATATISSARNFTLGSATSTIQVDPTFTYTLSGSVADGAAAGTLNKTGTGTLALTGTLTGLTGGANVTAGTLSLPGTLGATNSTSTINVASAGTVTFTGGTLTNTITGSGNVNNTNVLTVTGDVTAFAGTWTANNQYSLNGTANGSGIVPSSSANAAYVSNFNSTNSFILGTAGTYNFGSLSGTTGTLRGGNAISGNVTASIGNLNTDTTFAGAFLNNTTGATTSLSVTKVGTGTFTLTGSSSFTGAMTINGGTVVAAGNGALGQLGATVGGTATTAVGPSAIAVNGGTTLGLSGTTTGTGTATPTGVFDRVKDTAPISLGTASGAGGTISLSGTGPILEGTAVSNSGGTLTNSPFRNATATSAIGLGALTLTSSSALNYGGVIGTLVFTSFTPGGFTLAVNGYTTTSNGTTISGVDGTDDRLIFSQDQATNITNGAFTFNGSTANIGEIALDNGFYEVVSTTVAPVPEPATWLGAALLVGTLGFSRRRQISSWLAAPRVA